MSEEINWGDEVDNLSEGGDGLEYWSPDEGEQEVTFLDTGGEGSEYGEYQDQKKFDDSEQTYVKFLVEVDGEKFVWDMKKGSTPGSKFGQLARFAEAKGGLEGETVTWFRQGEGQQTNHILMDLNGLDDEDSEDETIFDEDE